MRRIHAGWKQLEVRGGVQRRYDGSAGVAKRRTWKMTLGCSGRGERCSFLISDPLRIYINAMDTCLTQISGHAENNSWIRQIRTLARSGHGPKDLMFTWLWELHWALPSFDYKDTSMQKDPIDQTQERHRATERLPPNLSTNRKNAIKWKNGNKIFFY